MFSWVNFGLALTAFIIYIWGVRAIFQRVGASDPKEFNLVKSVSVFCMLAILCGLALSPAGSITRQATAALLFIGSILLFFSAAKANKEKILTLAFSNDAPTRLLAVGPYRWIRHPFYASYSLGYFAGGLGSGGIYYFIPFIVMFFLYYWAASREEGKFGNSDLAEEYRVYRERTGMFLPLKAIWFSFFR